MARKKGIDWDAQPLGVVRDSDLARRLSVSPVAVRHARLARGIPAYRSPTAPTTPIDWDAQPLGVVGDTVLARRLGVTPSAATSARVRRGIAPAGKRRKPRVLAATIAWDNQPLGKESDRELARLLGVHHRMVSRQREMRGIPPFDRSAWWDAQPLGQIPDTDITDPQGMHRSAAMLARKQRGIPAFVDMIECQGEKKTLRGWASSAGIGVGTLWARLRAGWSVERALATPAERVDLESGLRDAESEFRRLSQMAQK